MGIAARDIRMPVWNGNRNRGNHNGVEFYNPTGLEAATATNVAACADDDNQDRSQFLQPLDHQTNVDDLKTQPCSKWSCEANRLPNLALMQQQEQQLPMSTQLNLRSIPTRAIVPLHGNGNYHDVPSEDSTKFDQRVCSQC